MNFQCAIMIRHSNDDHIKYVNEWGDTEDVKGYVYNAPEKRWLVSYESSLGLRNVAATTYDNEQSARETWKPAMNDGRYKDLQFHEIEIQ